MKKLILGVCALALVSLAPRAHAGIYLEPYLGYYMLKTKQSGSSDDKATGMGYGARLGYGMLGLHFGVEYATGKLTTDETPSSDITPNDLGAFVSYTFPIMIRVYGTYFFKSKAESKQSTQTFDISGKGYKLGVGYTGLPFITINFEMLKSTFDEVDSSSSGYSGPLTPEMTMDGYGLSVSLPFDF